MGHSGVKKNASTPLKTGTVSASPPPLFLQQFFYNLLPDDLAELPSVKQRKLAQSMWQLAQTRPRGTVSLRILNPTEKNEGWNDDHTVIEIISDDRPFLIDSITGELHRRGYIIHLNIHPVLRVRRDAKGQLLGLDGEKDDAESFMQIHLDHISDKQALKDLASALKEILGEVRAAVEDWRKMHDRALEIATDNLAPVKAQIPSDEIVETRDFLNWLSDDNFVFLGYRKFDIVKKDSAVQWKLVNGSGLGLLRHDELRLFGGMRDLTAQPPQILEMLKQKRLIIIVKTNATSRVHRNIPMDAVFVQRFNEDGQIVGEHLFIGLFTSTSYSQSSRDVPFLRRKIVQVLARANFDPEGHNGRALFHILDNYPRDELFQIDTEALYRNAIGIVQLQERARVKLFIRRDALNRFVTCLIYVPRDRFDTSVRLNIKKKLEAAFEGNTMSMTLRIDDSHLARLFATVLIGPAAKMPSTESLESELRELCRSWSDRIHNTLAAALGEVEAVCLLHRYGEAFPRAYCDATSASESVHDIKTLEIVRTQDRFIVDLQTQEKEGSFRLKLFSPTQRIALSDILPLIENMGLKVKYMVGPHKVQPRDSVANIYIHDFFCRAAKTSKVDFKIIKPLFEEAFARVWQNDIENDAFNSLTLFAGLDWREIVVLRALARYLRQLRVPYGQHLMASTLLAHPEIAQNLVVLFMARHDPDLKGNRDKQMAAITERINSALGSIEALEEDRIIRRFLNLVQSSLRTNFFQRTKDGAFKPCLSIKFDSRAIDYMPLPKPLVEIFVYSPRVEAVHLRNGKVARGGIRWSDRREDYRSEILGLMKAQVVKNTVIVPTGSKGGFIVKQPPADARNMQSEAVACYRLMMRGLLDITDNSIGAKIVPPARVVRHDGDDPYLVVAADKGTATFSDIANALAQEYGFWLDDAFASGGSVGYDHKQMGITARGVWEAVKRHFRELGKDIQTTDFTCVGVGDMSGDVFGNGMLLSKHNRLIGAFDHRHIFCDPDPDAATSHAERLRLFKLPRSSWADYNNKKISKGGGIFSRKEKSIKLSPEIKLAFGITSDSLSPNDLIQAILKCKVDLLYFGGIGTYIKSHKESNDQVGDRANDSVRIDGRDIQALVVGEGANLGMTQRGRVEYSLNGGHINTDAIDNSAGVDTSDHEVNIKILQREIVSRGDLTFESRNKLLASMTDEVAALVLRDNYLQTQALTLAETRAAELLPQHARNIRFLEKSGFLNRKVEFLPDETEIEERLHIGKGLTRAELAVLFSYAKIWLYEQIITSDLPDDPFLRDELIAYFPTALRKKYADDIIKHRLRREIVATCLTNEFINRFGAYFIFEMADRTGRSAPDIVRSYLLVRATFDLPVLWNEIEKLDNRISAQTQTSLLLSINHMITQTITWFLTENALEAKLAPAIAKYQSGVKRLNAWLNKGSSEIISRSRTTAEELIQKNIPSPLAKQIAILPWLTSAPDMTRLADKAGCSIEQIASAFFGLNQRLGLEWLRERSETIVSADNQWQREAIAALLDDMTTSLRMLVTGMLSKAQTKGKSAKCDDPMSQWLSQNAPRLERYDALLNEMKAAGTFDMAMLTLASRQLEGLV